MKYNGYNTGFAAILSTILLSLLSDLLMINNIAISEYSLNHAA